MIEPVTPEQHKSAVFFARNPPRKIDEQVGALAPLAPADEREIGRMIFRFRKCELRPPDDRERVEHIDGQSRILFELVGIELAEGITAVCRAKLQMFAHSQRCELASGVIIPWPA